MKKIIICTVAFIAVLTANASLATVTNRSSSPTKVETNDKNRTWVEDVKGWKCEGFFYKYASDMNKTTRNRRAQLSRR